MYYPETYFKIDILNEILKEFDWPCPYETARSGADIVLYFPKCELLIIEGFDSHMYAVFPNCYTGRNDMQDSLKLSRAVGVIRDKKMKDPNYKDPLLHELDDDPSLDKVKDGIRNICILIQTFLLPCVVDGDFSWVDDYNKECCRS